MADVEMEVNSGVIPIGGKDEVPEIQVKIVDDAASE